MKLANIAYRNIITRLKNNIQSHHVVTPVYASDANSLWGTQLSLLDHIHPQYIDKTKYLKTDNYFTNTTGYYYDYAQAIDGVSDFASRYHNHDSLYMLLGSTVTEAYALANHAITDLASVDHTHTNYAELTTIFDTTTQLGLYTIEHFALIGHRHDDVYYQKTDSVANAQYLQITDSSGETIICSDKDLAKRIHFHSYYLSIVEADKSLVPSWILNSLLYEYYLSPSIAASVATAKISNLNINATFTAPVLTWYSSTTEGTADIPAALNTNLVKLSSYTMHQYITPPSVSTLKLVPKDADGNDLNYVTIDTTANVAAATSSITLIDTYVTPGRAVALYIEKTNEIAPLVLNITQPVIAVGNADPMPVSIFTAISDVIVTEPDPNDNTKTISVHKWQLLIYRYNVPHSNLIQTHVRLAVIA